RAQGRFHHRDRDPQPAAGRARVEYHQLLLHGQHGGTRPDPNHVHLAGRSADRGVPHWTVRMSPSTGRPTIAPMRDTTPDGPAVEARGFSFWYGKVQRLFDLDLSFSRCAVTAIIGPSGSGKS